MHEYDAKIVRVIDGDTIDALIDLGFSVWIKKRIRMSGINAPESRTRDLEEKKLGIAAKERLQSILNDSSGSFTLVSHGVGKYGRCLGELFIGDKSINEQLIIEGIVRRYE